MEKIHTPYGRISVKDTFHRNIFTVIEFDIADREPFVAMDKESSLPRIVKKPVSVYADIFRIFCINRTENKCILVKIYTLITLKNNLSGHMHTGSEVVCNTVGIFTLDRL